MIDPYSTLQIKPGATADEVKIAYRRLAKQFHPDLHPNDAVAAQRFNDVTAAYDLLSDTAKRRDYDRQAGLGHRNRSMREEGLEAFRRAWSFRSRHADTVDVEEPPRPSVGNGGEGRTRSRTPLRGDDLHQAVQVSFLDAAFGTKSRVSLGDRMVDITIPPLTEDGKTLRLKGQGGPPERGDLYGDALIAVTVTPHPLFTRSGMDIRLPLPVSVPEAVLGASITVPTLWGMVQLKVPAGSNADAVLRLRGKGLRGPGGGQQGDQLVVLKIILPDSREPDFIDLIEEWDRKHQYSARPAGWEKL